MAQTKFDKQAIKDLREQKGLSQLEFARILGTSRQMVQRWESGDCVPQVDTLCRISDVFHLDVDFFFNQNDVALHQQQDMYQP